MFSGQTQHLPYIRTYAEARAHWDKTPHSKRSKKWETYQRPLRNTQQKHYRLEALNPDKFIDVVLFGTTMARYYKPDADGHERVLYMGDDTLTSKKFMRDVLSIGGPDNIMFNTNSERVAAPVYGVHCMRDNDGTPFSADFCFVAPGHILTEKSQHTKHWHRVTTDNDRAHKAKLREVWSPFLDLMMYRMPELEENVSLEYRAGRPFAGLPIKFNTARTVIAMGQKLVRGEMPLDEEVAAFVEYTQAVFDQLASKRGYEQDGFTLKHPWSGSNTATSAYSALDRPITPHQLRKSLCEKVVALGGGLDRTGYVEIPQFVAKKEMPKSNVYVSNTQPQVLSNH